MILIQPYCKHGFHNDSTPRYDVKNADLGVESL